MLWREENPTYENLDLVAHAVFGLRVDGVTCAGQERGEQRREALLLRLLTMADPSPSHDDTIRCHWPPKRHQVDDSPKGILRATRRRVGSPTGRDTGRASQHASVGAAWQNGYAERLMRTIKEEEVYLSEYRDYADAYQQIGRFLDDIYMHKRIHSALGYLTPVEFALQWQQTETAAEVIP